MKKPLLTLTSSASIHLLLFHSFASIAANRVGCIASAYSTNSTARVNCRSLLVSLYARFLHGRRRPAGDANAAPWRREPATDAARGPHGGRRCPQSAWLRAGSPGRRVKPPSSSLGSLLCTLTKTACFSSLHDWGSELLREQK